MMMTMMSRVEKGNRDEGGGNSIRLQIELYAACWRDNDIYARQVCDVWPAHVCFEGGMGKERGEKKRMRNGERQKLSRVLSSPPPSRIVSETPSNFIRSPVKGPRLPGIANERNPNRIEAWSCTDLCAVLRTLVVEA